MINETTGATSINYTYGDDLISQSNNGQTSYYHYDGLGSTRQLSDATGTITDSYDYQAFGKLLNQTGSTVNNYLFTGEQFDKNLDQYYLRARYYNQNTGRFTQQDTYAGSGSDPVTLHKYLYVHADPANGTDPSGLFMNTTGFTVAQNASMAIGASNATAGAMSYLSLTSKIILTVGVAALPTNLQVGPTVQRARQRLETSLDVKVTERGRSKSDLLFHYTDEVGARGILSCMCITPTQGYNHPDGVYRPKGAYATELAPWLANPSQVDLLSLLYNKPRGRVATHYVAILKVTLWRRVTGVEWVKSEPIISGGPNGYGVQVIAIGSGANLMREK